MADEPASQDWDGFTRERLSVEGDDVVVAWRPPDHTPGAVVVLAHGLGLARRGGLLPYARRFVDEGFGVAAFDHRHLGLSEGEPRELVDIGRQRQDWSAVVRWVASRREVDADRIGLWGTSFSGGHAVVTAADLDVACVVVQVPFLDGRATPRTRPLTATARIGAVAAADAFGARFGRAPIHVALVGPHGSGAVLEGDDHLADMRSLHEAGVAFPNRITARSLLAIPLDRPVTRAANLRCPTLLQIAEADTITPVGPAERLAADAPRVELRRHDTTHFGMYLDRFEEVVGEQVSFLHTHLRTRPDAAG